MPISALLHLECDPVEPIEGMKHAVFSCLQWKRPNLEVMPQAAKQRFAIMYSGWLDGDVINTLERAHIFGAMSPVNLIAIHGDELRLFLDASVSSTTFPTIETLWEWVSEIDSRRPWKVIFSTAVEVSSGHSEYALWEDAKEIFDSYSLGIEPYTLPTIDCGASGSFCEDDLGLNISSKSHAQSLGFCITPDPSQILSELTHQWRACSTCPPFFTDPLCGMTHDPMAYSTR
jgi:hypothetical protein